MIERIDLFMPPRSRYQVLHHFTLQLAEALSRLGVRTRVIEAQRERPKEFIDTILSDPPECTLSFNGLLPDAEGRFFCDLIQIPHVACLVDAPQHFLTLTQSPNSIITCVDRFACDFFEGLNFQNVIFLPHAVDKKLMVPPSVTDNREYDVIFLGSYIDFEEIQHTWQNTFDPALCKALEEAAESVLMDRELSCVQALAQALDHQMKHSADLDPNKLDFVTILDQLEDYINGKDRVELVKAIKDVKVHIFGEPHNRWKKHLKGSPNVVVHEQVPYEKALDLMLHSKIVLNSCPSIKQGAHERIFAGISCGAAVLTNENAYMHENFKNRENILFYRPGKWSEANQLVNEYVHDDNKRLTLVKKSQEIVLEGHTWDHRAATLISELGPILERIAVKNKE